MPLRHLRQRRQPLPPFRHYATLTRCQRLMSRCLPPLFTLPLPRHYDAAFHAAATPARYAADARLFSLPMLIHD